MGLGRIAYEAYCKSSDGKSLISGQALPTWGYLSPPIQAAWDAAANAVAVELADEAAISQSSPLPPILVEADDDEKTGPIDVDDSN